MAYEAYSRDIPLKPYAYEYVGKAVPGGKKSWPLPRPQTGIWSCRPWRDRTAAYDDFCCHSRGGEPGEGIPGYLPEGSGTSGIKGIGPARGI